MKSIPTGNFAIYSQTNVYVLVLTVHPMINRWHGVEGQLYRRNQGYCDATNKPDKRLHKDDTRNRRLHGEALSKRGDANPDGISNGGEGEQSAPASIYRCTVIGGQSKPIDANAIRARSAAGDVRVRDVVLDEVLTQRSLRNGICLAIRRC